MLKVAPKIIMGNEMRFCVDNKIGSIVEHIERSCRSCNSSILYFKEVLALRQWVAGFMQLAVMMGLGT